MLLDRCQPTISGCTVWDLGQMGWGVWSENACLLAIGFGSKVTRVLVVPPFWNRIPPGWLEDLLIQNDASILSKQRQVPETTGNVLTTIPVGDPSIDVNNNSNGGTNVAAEGSYCKEEMGLYLILSCIHGLDPLVSCPNTRQGQWLSFTVYPDDRFFTIGL